ncbi:YceI family protein [Methylovorus mays]|uniref:YceI family protein n=1 Tax=Methylovorus mays TaxID=184077 RepID=UPI001E396E0D|nr:YceI family protein [Methylovorus mays]MCB5206339.1 YceI family protein [Methylovorus mays]
MSVVHSRFNAAFLPLALLSLVAFSVPAHADWVLNPQASDLSFVSIKKNSIAEIHHFKELSGSISDAGAFSLSIKLASVDTGIAVRDERMRNMLFDTAMFPSASVSGKTPANDYSSLPAGTSRIESLKFTLDLHGKTVELNSKVRVTSLSNNKLLISTIQPVIVDAANYELVAGIEKLREAAQLPAISTAVPVTLNLVFDRQ